MKVEYGKAASKTNPKWLDMMGRYDKINQLIINHWNKTNQKHTLTMIKTRSWNKFIPMSSHSDSRSHSGLKKWAASRSECTSLPAMYCAGHLCRAIACVLTKKPKIEHALELLLNARGNAWQNLLWNYIYTPSMTSMYICAKRCKRHAHTSS